VQTLYGTQLEAFSSALACSLHCTQGPPGTGKSYLGVCLALALDLIRTRAEKAGHACGPIQLLSYKNHALDEFLLDVIKARAASSSGALRPGELIRCGKSDDESLARFSEKFSPLEIAAQGRLNRAISVQRQSRATSQGELGEACTRRQYSIS
jgi:hypothetical protein